jgi:dihydrofolate synthase/folylpolyglutamate synthase
MDFQQASTYLLSLGNEVSTMKLGLENIRKLLAAIDNPQNNYLKVQVAGTNGKGSVCAFLNSICVTAGIKTGMFTSPHLISMTERVQINGEDIGEDGFARLATRVRSASEDLVASGELESVPTYFEQVTAIGLLAFAEAKVALAILETGLGGRLDATTAANAEIAAITRIDLDHQQYLGETIEEIAAEKAAIIHEGSEVVVGEQSPKAMEVILERCLKMGVEPRLTSEIIAREVSPEPLSTVGFGVGNRPPTKFPTITFLLPGGGYRSLGLGLRGEHQIENARVAILVAQILGSRFSITDKHVARGLSRLRHPGRLEWIGQILLDGAHNIGGARALVDYLDEFVTNRITMIFGSMDDKAVSEIARIVLPRVDKLILTRPANSRAMPADKIRSIISQDILPDESVFVIDSVDAALAKAKAISADDDLIVVTGSLYLVGEVRKIVTARRNR